MRNKLDIVAANRRSFLRTAGISSLGAAAAALVATGPAKMQAQTVRPGFQFDTPTEVLTAALIAEDLATTFYYNSLVGPVVQDPNLAGPGATAAQPNPTTGNIPNLNYVQAALSEEISHANLLRTLLGGTSAANDPVQTFYFPSGTFDVLSSTSGASFLTILDALENAFIGAYLNAVRGFSYMAAQTSAGRGVYYALNGSSLSSDQLGYYAEVAASILGVEAEHRALGRVISVTNPANNVCYEQTDGQNGVYNGPASAVAALTPFLTSSNGTGYSLSTALSGQSTVSLPCTGGIPPV